MQGETIKNMVFFLSNLFPNCECLNSSARHKNHNLKEQATFWRYTVFPGP